MTTRRVLLVLIGAAALSVGLIATSQLGARDREEAPAAVGATHSSLAGIPQRGIVLGDPDAPVTLVEYVDLQCPYCAELATRTFPVLVSGYVRTGKLRIVFQGLAFIGPDSDTALRTALAAGARIGSGTSSRASTSDRARRTPGSPTTSSTTSRSRPASTPVDCVTRGTSHG